MWAIRIVFAIGWTLFFYGTMKYHIALLFIGAAIILVSFVWLIVAIHREQKVWQAEEEQKQAEREADPEWAEYQRLDAKFYPGDHEGE